LLGAAIYLWYIALPILGAIVGWWLWFFFGVGLSVIIYWIVASIKEAKEKNGQKKLEEMGARNNNDDNYRTNPESENDISNIWEKALETPIETPIKVKKEIKKTKKKIDKNKRKTKKTVQKDVLGNQL
jgi:hypothetical protein